MKALLFASAALVLGLSLAGPARAQFDAKLIDHAKAATALVEVPDVTETREAAGKLETVTGTSYGSAVCIRADGIYVTNAHVVDGANDESVTLVLRPNQDGEKSVKAKVLRTDEDLDLAVLRVTGDFDHAPIELGADDSLFETMQIVAFGYPFGTALASDDGYPDVSVNVGRVTSLRKREGKLDMIQLDAQLNPGNSGGPTLDSNGKLIGIVGSGVFATGVNFAIPITSVRSFLDRPDVKFEPPQVVAARRFQPTPFEVIVTPLFDSDEKCEVELKLTDGQTKKERVFKGVPDEAGKWSVSVPPCEGNAGAAKGPIPAKIVFASGSVECRLQDIAFSVAKRPVNLSVVSRIRIDGTPGVDSPDGRRLDGPIELLGPVEVDFGGTTATLDLSKAKSIEIEAPAGDPFQVAYAIKVLRGDQVLYEATGELGTSSSSSADSGSLAPAGTRISKFREAKRELKLPATATDVIVGGNGRWMLFVLESLRKAAVLDNDKGEIVGYLPLATTDAMMAAGAEKLVVVYPAKNVIERIDLATLKKELTKTLPMKGVVKQICMGSGSDGPILVHWAAGTEALSQAGFGFLDLARLSPLELEGNVQLHSSFRDQTCIRASATGDLFGLWNLGVSPSGIEMISIVNGKLTSKREHDSAGAIVPNSDGTAIYCSSGAIYSADLKRKNSVSRGIQPPPCLPTMHPAFYLTVMGLNPYFRRSSGDQNDPVTLTVNLIDTGESLLTITDLDELKPKESSQSFSNGSRYVDITLDKRIQYIPQADLLVTLAESDDRVVLRRLNLKDGLEEAGIDYLYVASVPPRFAIKGKAFRYAVEIESKRGDVKCELASGPEGMTMKGRVVEWSAPKVHPDEPVSVVLSVSDASGQQTFHSFNLTVK